MTIRQLNDLFYLDRLIDQANARIRALREAADIRSPSYDPMPGAPGPKDRIGEIVPKIVDESRALEEEIMKAANMKAEILDFIAHVPFARMRLILRLRFIEQRSWQEVADEIGGKETEYSVKQACYRFLEGRAGASEPLEGQVSWFDDTDA